MLPDLDWIKELLEVKNISLQKAKDKVCLWESAREQASQMANHNQVVGVLTVAGKVILPATRSAQQEGKSV